MNILYYDKTMNLCDLEPLWETMRSMFSEEDLLFLPNTVQLFIDVPAESLFDIGDKIGIALEKIKEERPEEYEKAYNNRMITIRDKQWRDVMRRQIEIHNKRNH